MALSVGSQRLALQNNEVTSKSLVLVKLTDSALGAIAQFLKQNNSVQSTKYRPTIQFLQNSGTITVPLDETGRTAKFSFSLTSTEDINGPQGSFECLQSTKSGYLQTLGPIQDKLQVQAEDDTYTRFGEKMSEVKKENEKRTTVFIDRPGGSISGGLVGGSGNHHHQSQKFVRKPAQHGSAGNVSAAKSFAASRDRINRFPTSGSLASQHGASHHNQGSSNPSDVLSGSHPMLDRKSSAMSYHHKQNSEVMKRPLRERIVHLLAVRPFKKPELLLRITRDGVREKDKNSITMILKQVSSMKDNTYHLLRHIWNDVSEDWPFYTEEERQSFRRRKPQNLTPPGSDGSTGSSISSGHSSSSSHPASPQPPSMLKRGHSSMDRYFDGSSGLGNGGGGSSPAAKKKRVSNYMRPPDFKTAGENKSPLHLHHHLNQSPSSSGRSPLNDTNNVSAVMMHGSSSSTVTTNNEGKVSGWLMHNNGDVRASPSTHKFATGDMSITPSSSPDSQDSAMGSGNDMTSSLAAPAQMELKDYLQQFPAIVNVDQRRKYKAEFNKNYALYRQYHDYLEGISKKFAQLENQLRQEREGSDSWMQLKQKIYQEYHANKTDAKYTRIRQEFHYLHDKLAHIKNLVHEFDTRSVAAAGVPPSRMSAAPTKAVS